MGANKELVAELRARWTNSESIKLHVGECAAQELRTAKAVAISILSELGPALQAAEAERDRLKAAWQKLGSSETRDRLARKIGCNADLLHDALQVEAHSALQEPQS